MSVDKKSSIIRALRESGMPCDVENVRITAGLKSWEATKAMLLELMVEGKIYGRKTTKSWIFWQKEKASGGCPALPDPPAEEG